MAKWISILMMVAFVMTTIMPVSSHAMMHSDAAAEEVQNAQAAEKHDCHHGAKADSTKTTNESKTSKSCCGEDMCKCLNGFCHGGLAKIFGNSGDSLIVLSHTAAKVDFFDENADSSLSSRLKRPPRA